MSTTDYTLAYGTHPSPDAGRCAMEWVAHLAGEPHSDHPACVSPVVRSLCVALNDGLDTTARQRLRPYLTRTIGTADDTLDTARSWMALDWLLREFLSRWLTAAAMTAQAARHRTLAPIVDERALHAALAPLRATAADARRIRRATYGGARRWGLALATGATGRESAWPYAAAGAWEAARLGIDDPSAGDARTLAGSIAAAAAAVTVRRARGDDDGRGRLRGRTPPPALLAPQLAAFGASAIGLLDRMLPLTTIDDLGQAAGAGAAAEHGR